SSDLAKKVCRYFCGLVFAAAATAKALSPQALAYALTQVTWVPEQLRTPLVVIVPGFECALGAALLLGWRPRLVAKVSFSVLLLFTVTLLILPKDIDCGCFGQFSVLAWLSAGWGAVSRNVLLLSLTGWLAFNKKARAIQTKELIHA